LSQSSHHLVSGVGARVVSLPADNLVARGQAKLSSEVVFGLGGSGVDLLLGLAVTEKAEDEDLIIFKIGLRLGLQLADEALAALQGVHGPDEGEEGVLVAGDSVDSRPGVTPLLVAVARFFLTTEAGGQEKGSSSQFQGSEDGNGRAEGATGGGQEGDGEGTVVGHGGQGTNAIDRDHEAGGEEKNQKGFAVHVVFVVVVVFKYCKLKIIFQMIFSAGFFLK